MQNQPFDYTPTATPHAGRVYIVTGGANGIGFATAQILAKEGASLGIFDVNQAALDEAEKTIKALGAKCIVRRVDVTNRQQVEDAVAEVHETFGRLDGGANSAGLGSPQATDIEGVDDEKFEKVHAVNVKGVLNSMRAEVKYLKAGGSIVNLASVSGLFGEWNAYAYGTSKHAVIGLARIFTKDYAKKGIRCNSVCPGAIETNMLMTHGGTSQDKNFLDRLGSITQLGRLGQPHEIGHLISFLLSEKASFITGATYVADGGFLS